MTLYEINAQIAAFLDKNVDPETGEVLNLETLGDLQLEHSVKLENYALAVKNLDAEIAAIKLEEDKLKARRERLINTRDKLKSILMDELHGEKISTARVQVSYRKSQFTEVTDAGKIPAEFLDFPPPKPDLNAIKAAIKAGGEIDGARLSERVSMIIK